ncbi:MAG: hypothetical protein ABW146_19620, partial [Candidatus Sedimenticola sp. 6PFRAG7]
DLLASPADWAAAVPGRASYPYALFHCGQKDDAQGGEALSGNEKMVEKGTGTGAPRKRAQPLSLQGQASVKAKPGQKTLHRNR